MLNKDPISQTQIPTSASVSASSIGLTAKETLFLFRLLQLKTVAVTQNSLLSLT